MVFILVNITHITVFLPTVWLSRRKTWGGAFSTAGRAQWQGGDAYESAGVANKPKLSQAQSQGCFRSCLVVNEAFRSQN